MPSSPLKQASAAGNVGSRLAVAVVAVAVVAIFAFVGPGAPLLDTVGMLAAVVAVTVVLWRVPFGVYSACMAFVLLAAAGSLLNFYARVPYYDRYLHTASGLLLAHLGCYLAAWLLRRDGVTHAPRTHLSLAFFFAAAGAGCWEIGEFSADQLLGAHVQGGNFDTMGDIVCGVAGALVYCLVRLIVTRCRAAAGNTAEETPAPEDPDAAP